MKKNWFLLLISGLTITLSIVLMFIIGFDFGDANMAVPVCYGISKGIFTAALLTVTILAFAKTFARGHFLFIIVPTLVMQLMPIAQRVIKYVPTFQDGLSVIILILSLIVYAVFVGFAFYSGKRQLASDNNPKYQAEEIEVVSQEESARRNGQHK